MNTTLMVKLAPTPEQHAALLETMERFNAACNYVADVAFQEKSANKFALQKLVYQTLRERFGLKAQMAVRVVGKVTEAYKRDKTKRVQFRKHGAMVYDQRILSWKGLDRVSILSLSGRLLIPVIMGEYQAQRLRRVRGQADLILRDGVFYLAVVVDAPEGTPIKNDDWLGVDLGIVNIASDSDGDVYSGAALNGIRHRHARLRAKLQSKGTKSAKRLLKKRRRKESRFARDVNHCISKKVVAKALDTSRGIALEDLTGIRERTTVKKAQRRTHHSWAFYQLRTFIQYKAQLKGVSVLLVDPRNTSRTCFVCGCVDKRNRPSQDKFLCVSCGHADRADTNAARNISRRAEVMRPNALTPTGPSASPRL